jgi:hypothetical protein
MKVKVASVAGHLAALVWVALRTFVVTLCLLALAGLVLAGLSWFFLRDAHWAWGAGAAVAAVVALQTLLLRLLQQEL